METEITILLCLAGIIFNAIIFFVIINIGRNVAKLRRSFSPDRNNSFGDYDWNNFYFFAYNGYKEDAKKALLMLMWKGEMMSTFINSNTKEEAENNYDQLKETYVKKFNLIGEDFPEYEYLRNILLQ